MGARLTYRQLLKETRALAREIRHNTDAHKRIARALDNEAKDTGRVAEQIAALAVDSATVAETREVARIMQGLSTTALAYASAAEDTSRTAADAERQAVADHGGIQEAVNRSPVPMADAAFYTQE